MRELEQLRDDCLVSVLQALRARDIGAGAVLARHERSLARPPRGRRVLADDATTSPSRSRCTRRRSRPTGSTTTATPTRAATSRSSATPPTRSSPASASTTPTSRAGSYFTVESHLSHLREALLDDRLAVTTQVLDCDPRRLHVFHSLWREGDGALLATAEQLFLHVDTVARRAAPAGAEVLRARPADARGACGAAAPRARGPRDRHPARLSAAQAAALMRASRLAAAAASLRARLTLPSVRVATTIT